MLKRASLSEHFGSSRRPLSFSGLSETAQVSETDYNFLMNEFSSTDKRLIKIPDYYSYNDERTFIRCGSVRGVRNGVKKTIGQLLLQCQWTVAPPPPPFSSAPPPLSGSSHFQRNYEEEDRGKVVIYLTSLGVVRRTWERCRQAVAILDNHLVEFERRDLGFSPQLKLEFQNRVGNDPELWDLPAIFVDGRYFGVSPLFPLPPPPKKSLP